MPTISENCKLVTFINVFTVKPEHQQELLNLLASVTSESVRHIEGFISASLHRGLDGSKVAMYAQWRSLEDYQAMRGRSSSSLARALEIATFEPGMYEVMETFMPASD